MYGRYGIWKYAKSRYMRFPSSRRDAAAMYMFSLWSHHWTANANEDKTTRLVTMRIAEGRTVLTIRLDFVPAELWSSEAVFKIA